MITRRRLLRGLGVGLFAAPAIVRTGSLMPIRALRPAELLVGDWLTFTVDKDQTLWVITHVSGKHSYWPMPKLET